MAVSTPKVDYGSVFNYQDNPALYRVIGKDANGSGWIQVQVIKPGNIFEKIGDVKEWSPRQVKYMSTPKGDPNPDFGKVDANGVYSGDDIPQNPQSFMDKHFGQIAIGGLVLAMTIMFLLIHRHNNNVEKQFNAAVAKINTNTTITTGSLETAHVVAATPGAVVSAPMVPSASSIVTAVTPDDPANYPGILNTNGSLNAAQINAIQKQNGLLASLNVGDDAVSAVKTVQSAAATTHTAQ